MSLANGAKAADLAFIRNTYLKVSRLCDGKKEVKRHKNGSGL